MILAGLAIGLGAVATLITLTASLMLSTTESWGGPNRDENIQYYESQLAAGRLVALGVAGMGFIFGVLGMAKGPNAAVKLLAVIGSMLSALSIYLVTVDLGWWGGIDLG
jgi:hypothetical protein